MVDGPLIVQSDKTLLLEVDHVLSEDARREIAPFAELERAPEHIHTYRLTPLGLWNARAAGHDAEGVVDTLLRYSRYAVPHSLLVDVADTMDRYGKLELRDDPAHGLVMHTSDLSVLEEVLRSKKTAGMIGHRIDESTVAVHPSERGHLKQALLKIGWPADLEQCLFEMAALAGMHCHGALVDAMTDHPRGLLGSEHLLQDGQIGGMHDQPMSWVVAQFQLAVTVHRVRNID